MAKRRKAVIDLSGAELAFEQEGRSVRLITFDPNTMTLRVNIYDGGKQVGSDTAFPFAHLPKSLKQAVKPN